MHRDGMEVGGKRRFSDHRRWMWRSYLLLCSAVVIRVIGGLATVTGFSAMWVDQLTPWISWVAPLVVFELCATGYRQRSRSLAQFLRLCMKRPMPLNRQAVSHESTT